MMELVNATRKAIDSGCGAADPAVREATEAIAIMLSLVAPFTAEEMWEKETVFALKKNGAVRAKSLHATMEEAEAALKEAGKGFYIETRPGERTRCKYYCPVSSFCQQYQQYKEEQENAET
jgi:leucyl-tRNA synthetase